MRPICPLCHSELTEQPEYKGIALWSCHNEECTAFFVLPQDERSEKNSGVA